MKHTILAIALALTASAASAKGASVAISAATRGHVSNAPAVAALSSSRAIAPVCLWQVPELLHWINVSAIAHMYIQTDSWGERKGQWALRLRIMGTDPRDYPTPVYATSRANAIKLQESLALRIAECAEGTK